MGSFLCKQTVRWPPGRCVAVLVRSVGLALVTNGRSHQILGRYLLACGSDTALTPAGIWAVGRPIAPPKRNKWGPRLTWGGESSLAVGTLPLSATSQPSEIVTSMEWCIPVHHSPLRAVGIALGASGLSSSGQKKGCDILEAARLCG